MITVPYIKNKRNIWQRIQRRRNAWGNKFMPLFRISLNKQFKDLAEKINEQNYKERSLLDIFRSDAIEKRMTELYSVVGVDFAKSQVSELKGLNSDLLTKEDEWLSFMSNYVKRKLWRRIESINQTSIDIAGRIINDTLSESVDEGLGAYETATKVKKALVQKGIEYNQWRALRITRTEIMSASNIGSLEGARSTGEQLEKFWIATYDSRTRDTHLSVEAQNPKAMNEGFQVGAYLMECPGDPDGGAEEVINCRCTLAFQVKGW